MSQGTPTTHKVVSSEVQRGGCSDIKMLNSGRDQRENRTCHAHAQLCIQDCSSSRLKLLSRISPSACNEGHSTYSECEKSSRRTARPEDR